MDDKIAELEKLVYNLEHRLEKNEIRIEQNTGDCKQLWMFVQNYLTTQIRKIGDFRVSKKTIATFFVSIALWIVTNLLRILDII